MERCQALALSGIASLLLAGMAAADTVALLSVPGYSGGSHVEGYAGWFVLHRFDLSRSTRGSTASQDLVVVRSSADGDLLDELSRRFYPPRNVSLDLRIAVVEVPDHGSPIERAGMDFSRCLMISYEMSQDEPLVETTTFTCAELRNR